MIITLMLASYVATKFNEDTRPTQVTETREEEYRFTSPDDDPENMLGAEAWVAVPTVSMR